MSNVFSRGLFLGVLVLGQAYLHPKAHHTDIPDAVTLGADSRLSSRAEFSGDFHPRTPSRILPPHDLFDSTGAISALAQLSKQADDRPRLSQLPSRLRAFN